MYQLDPATEIQVPDDNSLFPYINNDIEYGLFEDIVDSYYLDSPIKDDFHCDQDCYTHQQESTVDDHSISYTHAYDHIVQQIQDLSDSTQQHTLHSMEENTSLFTNDSATPCDYNITNQNFITDNTNDTNISHAPKQFGIHSQSKHTYRNTFGETNIQYHDFDNKDILTFTDKYMALLQQELQNPYWCLHDPVSTKSYQIPIDMDIETMPHAMYFTSNTDTVTKINHIPYQTIVYNENRMFTTKLMNDTPVEIFIDNGATPFILPLHTYNKFPILHTYPKILGASDLLILSNLRKPWTIACKDVSRVFEIEYSTYCILNRSELCECSLIAGNYLLSYTSTNCGNAPEARDSYVTTYYSFNKIVLDIITEKFDIQVDENT